jgi:CRP-like cAMP-binding protein
MWSWQVAWLYSSATNQAISCRHSATRSTKSISERASENEYNYRLQIKALLAETSKQAARSATCLALVDTVVLTLDRASFLEVIQHFKSDYRQRMKFLKDVIPNFERIAGLQTTENLMYSFKDDILEQGAYLTMEGKVG